eukprot:COSAG04_NODE_205_length_20393_cov_45.275796_4_plen_60_part_00
MLFVPRLHLARRAKENPFGADETLVLLRCSGCSGQLAAGQCDDGADLAQNHLANAGLGP